ncbi:MAG: DNA polymerase III subunit alpha [Anaerolineales bacterium]|nr:DNA polymerase III subunit alpha [Anaerolineales bacterium]
MPLAFTHLHTHSYFSLLEAVPSPAELAAAAARADQSAVALTDTHGLTGAIEFYDACVAQGVRPLLGVELAVCPPPGAFDPRPGRLVLLARDLAGWAGLCRLSSLAQTTPHRDPAQGVSFAALAREAPSLICLTGGHAGRAHQFVAAGDAPAARRWLGLLRELFGDAIYAEIAPAWPASVQSAAGLDEALSVAARAARVPVVATANVHILTPDQAPLQRTLTAMRVLTPLDRLPREAAAPPGAHFASAREMLLRHAAHPQAVGRSAEVADRCRLTLPLGVPHYPEIPLPPGQTALGELRRQAQAGAMRHYGALTPEITARLDHELTVIGDRGYAPLFLIMAEILAHARQTGVPTSSRGSAASSLVAHCLDITSPDPLRLNLYFERFLNPARATPPDVDTDLCSVRRDGVIQHVFDHYGTERVAMVATIQRFRERSALREVAKAHAFPPEEIKSLADALPQRWWAPAPPESPAPAPGDDPLLTGPFGALARGHPDNRHRAVFQQAAAVLGLPRHLSVHPGGVVISPGPLTDLVPRHLAGKGVEITQFDLASVARLGLVKIDLLGIRGLTVLGDVAPLVLAAGQLVPPGSLPLAALEAIPGDDPATRETVRLGRTIGCFQIESPGMRATLKEVGAQSVDDLMVALALYRPGPLTGGLKDAFVRRHLGQEPTTHLHPALQPLLDDTHGVILYQEQVLRIAHDLAGMSLAEADLLRRAMSHFDPGKQMQTLKERFIAGAAERSRVPADVAERVWELMAAFAGYGFPKAHAASYAQVAWRAAWCKAHFPAPFMAAVLANWGGYYAQRVYLNEARRLGLAVYPPHVNSAQPEFSVVPATDGPRLYMGLNQVRDLTQRTTARLLAERPFHSLADFLARADPRPQEAENLVRVGALRGFGTIPALLRDLRSGVAKPGQLALFGLAPAVQEPEWSLAERVAAQEDLLGAAVDANPLELYADRIAKSGALTTVAAAAQLGRRVRVAGLRQTWHRTPTARGDSIYFMTLEDLEGMLDVVIFGDVFRKYRRAFDLGSPFVLEGTLELDPGRGEPAIRAERVWSLLPAA